MITQSGISIRQGTSGDAEGIARVHVDSWRETYDGILPPRVLSAQTYARRLALWRQTPGFRVPARLLSARPIVAALDVAYGGFLKIRRAWR